MKKFFTILLLSAVTTVQAQYHIPNGSFELWKGGAGSTYQSSDGSLGGGKTALGMRQRPGDEPLYWEGSSINQKVSMEKKEVLIESVSANGSTAVKMTNKDVKVMGIGSTAPAFISFATPWVYAISKVANCDGGVYGGISFKGRPDAIKGRFNRSSNTGEKAHIIAYLWRGTFKNNIKSSVSNDTKDDTDKAVMGKESNLVQSGTLVASCDYEFASTNGWEEIVVPLNYVSDAAPEKVNVILSSGDYWTRGNIKHGSVLEADDVQFVYYSELSELKYNGRSLFVAGRTAYEVADEYDESKLTVKSNGRSATIEKKFYPNSNLLVITIKGGDYSENQSNSNSYTILFNQSGTVEPTPDGQVDYTPSYTGVKSNGSRWINQISLNSAEFANEAANTLVVDNSATLCFNDYTSSVKMKAGVGETVTMTVNIGDASWMNAYVYIDTDKNGFAASIADGSNWAPADDLVSYSFYNNDGSSDENGWNSAGESVSGDARSTTTLPQFTVPAEPGVYRVRVKLDWCNIDPKGDRDGKFGDFMSNGGQIVDFLLQVGGDEVVEPEPEPEPTPTPEPGSYTPYYTGEKSRNNRWINSVSLSSSFHNNEALVVDNSAGLCFNDYTSSVEMKAVAGETVTMTVNIGDASWMNTYVYIDADSDGFTASIADGNNWAPADDLVSYSFYNNGSDSDENGWNSAGEAISGDARSTTALPQFTVPAEVGVYRVRVKLDWCNIDPNGDQDGKFGDFMANGGQIVDFMLSVTEATGVDAVVEEQCVKGIFDMQGRKIEEITAPGVYIINGKKYLVK